MLTKPFKFWKPFFLCLPLCHSTLAAPKQPNDQAPFILFFFTRNRHFFFFYHNLTSSGSVCITENESKPKRIPRVEKVDRMSLRKEMIASLHFFFSLCAKLRSSLFVMTSCQLFPLLEFFYVNFHFLRRKHCQKRWGCDKKWVASSRWLNDAWSFGCLGAARVAGQRGQHQKKKFQYLKGFVNTLN